jgi:hypothetical protein
MGESQPASEEQGPLWSRADLARAARSDPIIALSITAKQPLGRLNYAPHAPLDPSSPGPIQEMRAVCSLCLSSVSAGSGPLKVRLEVSEWRYAEHSFGASLSPDPMRGKAMLSSRPCPLPGPISVRG